jgi:hypothetical protein
VGVPDVVRVAEGVALGEVLVVELGVVDVALGEGRLVALPVASGVLDSVGDGVKAGTTAAGGGRTRR